jgi:hypothetical protein
MRIGCAVSRLIGTDGASCEDGMGERRLDANDANGMWAA